MSKRLPRLPLKSEYHDGQVETIELGPRREVTLTIRLDPVWNGGDSTSRRLHLSAIQNFDDVAAILGGTEQSRGRAVDEIIAVVRPSKAVVGIDFARRGYIEFRGAKVSEL
jgi:hypothetical protein